MKRALHLENEFLKVSIYEDGSVDVLDKLSNVEWTRWPDGEPTGVVQLRAPDRGAPLVCHLSASNVKLLREKELKVRIAFEGFRCEGVFSLGGSMEASVSLDARAHRREGGASEGFPGKKAGDQTVNPLLAV